MPDENVTNNGYFPRQNNFDVGIEIMSCGALSVVPHCERSQEKWQEENKEKSEQRIKKLVNNLFAS